MRFFNIGFIVSRPMEQFARGLETDLRAFCNVSVLTADTYAQARELYQQNLAAYDAFMFSGNAFLAWATDGVTRPRRPCFALENFHANYHEIFFHHLINNRSFDFSRTFVDAVGVDGDVWGIRDIFPPGQLPYFLDAEFEKYFTASGSYAAELHDRVLDRHLYLHKNGLIDLSFTRFGLVHQKLLERGLASEYMLPAREHVVNYFMQVNNFLIQRMNRSSICCTIAIRFLSENVQSNQAQMARSSRAISEYGIARGYNFTYVRDRNRLEVLTRHQDLLDMTDNFTNVSFIEGFGLTAGSRTIIGIGSGSGWFQAKLNATRATEIVRPGDGHIYYVSDERVLGPLGRDKLYVERAPTPQLIQLAERFRLSHTDLQRIITYVKLTGCSIVSANDIAEHLGINLRSAYRLLLKIIEGDGAISFIEKTSRGRGRPKRLYDLTFTETVL